MDGDDVRMREARGGPCLAKEAFTGLRTLRHVRRQHLDRDVPVELDVAREIHDAHPAAADLALERIFARQGRLQLEPFRRECVHVPLTPV